jgi:hypothetical protein
VPNTPYGGNTTYAEVQAIFTPLVGKYVSDEVTAIGYNEATETFSGKLATVDLPSTSMSGTHLYQFKRENTNGLPAGTVFAGTNGLNLAKKVVYHILNPSQPVKSNLSDYSTLVGETDADFVAWFDKYVDYKAYYRLNFGEQAGGANTDINYGIKRNQSYDAVISGFLSLGAKSPEDLLEENIILSGRTNLTVNIAIRNWMDIPIVIDL